MAKKVSKKSVTNKAKKSKASKKGELVVVSASINTNPISLINFIQFCIIMTVLVSCFYYTATTFDYQTNQVQPGWFLATLGWMAVSWQYCQSVFFPKDKSLQ